jgi:hypothetical protein
MFYASGNVSSIGLYNMHDLMLQNLGKGTLNARLATAPDSA